MALFKMDTPGISIRHQFYVFCWILICILLWWPLGCCDCQRMSEEKDRRRVQSCADSFGAFLVEMSKTYSDSNIMKEVKGLSVSVRSTDDMAAMLDDAIKNMQGLLRRKEEAVEELKQAAERAMEIYGPYKKSIDFKDVSYINAKEVIVNKDFESMPEQSREDIMNTINYLPTEPTWFFKKPGHETRLNTNSSSIHVPTNIYDKSIRILNGVQWTTNLTDQFLANSHREPSLTWQYFCTSDGIFRIYPGMQWPRESDKVDTFDCRIRRWYIQAASYPKNILILLDSSGSMKGLRFAIARSIVSKILETLSDEDYFNIIEFSDEPRYVDECFNDTLMTANGDNIKRMQRKIEGLQANKFSDFEKALTKAFQLFKKEQMEFKEHKLCNKAIMIITDGAPENFDSVFEEYNWPEKSIRVFTFLIGKEVPENRQTKWMACVNKGKFTHISTRSDVQEYVQKYIKVLSRPLALKKARHKVWSAVYLDYVTDKADIKVPSGRPADLHMDFESDSVFEGLGLVMSITMPVFDTRDKVGPNDDEQDLIGVVGTDLRVNELKKFIPTFQLGVNGYAFAITNHGYVLFHPDYRPFYSEKRGMNIQHLKVKTKYTNVDLSQVELTVHKGTGWNKENPLRRYMLTSKSGGDNISVLTHSEGMKRARERHNRYQFKEVADNFKLVFVIPEGYGSRYLTVDPSSLLSVAEIKKLENGTSSNTDVAKWIYCWDNKVNNWTQLDITTVMLHFGEELLEINCEKEHMYRLIKDWEMTLRYAIAWEDRVKRFIVSKRDIRMVEGVWKIWMGTSSGLTRYIDVDNVDMDWQISNTQTIKSLYYKRAVDGWEDGYKYVFAGPVVASQKEFNFNTSSVTMSTAVIIGASNSTPVPAAVVAFSMKYSAFYNKFLQYTFNCSDYLCSCNDTEHYYCYLVDNNGYIMASNLPSRNGTGVMLGQHNGRLMRALLDDNIYKQLNLTDYQSMCETPVPGEQGSASSFIMNPLKLIARGLFWLISEIVLFFSEMNILNMSNWVCGKKGSDECVDTIPEELVRYLCGFVIDQHTGQKIMVAYVTSIHSCVQNVSRYLLNLSALNARKRRSRMPECQTHCASENRISYEAQWLNETNLVFVVMDASCICNESNVTDSDDSITDSLSEKPSDRFTFSLKAREVHYDDNTQCQNLRNFSDELKHIDITRAADTFCLDSSNETVSPCSQSQALLSSHVTSIIPALLTALLVSTSLS